MAWEEGGGLLANSTGLSATAEAEVAALLAAGLDAACEVIKANR